MKGGPEIIEQVEREVEDGNDWLWIKNAPSSQKFFEWVSVIDELKQAKVLDIISFRPTLSVSPLYGRRFTLLGIFLLNGSQKLGKMLSDAVEKMENGEEVMEQVKRELQRPNAGATFARRMSLRQFCSCDNKAYAVGCSAGKSLVDLGTGERKLQDIGSQFDEASRIRVVWSFNNLVSKFVAIHSARNSPADKILTAAARGWHYDEVHEC
ncbi:hypothetical protein AOQ84DRAFT_370662 [Glonium stellatum]|uniref:Uncharacterized protein n=1 Tax=Glonium stellatum TaxID=574774 RepID=A0A8E2FDE5_9PEZI|nr:hypothetical protein AOQ84DRAFT_370662 [Glonium stellatum]